MITVIMQSYVQNMDVTLLLLEAFEDGCDLAVIVGK